jgi:hypothetical protein
LAPRLKAPLLRQIHGLVAESSSRLFITVACGTASWGIDGSAIDDRVLTELDDMGVVIAELIAGVFTRVRDSFCEGVISYPARK